MCISDELKLSERNRIHALHDMVGAAVNHGEKSYNRSSALVWLVLFFLCVHTMRTQKVPQKSSSMLILLK